MRKNQLTWRTGIESWIKNLSVIRARRILKKKEFYETLQKNDVF